MADDPRSELLRKLDLLLSIHLAELGELALADCLYATANGLVDSVRAQARWIESERVIELPFTDPAHLEGQLEDLLTTKVICVPIDGDVPPQSAVTIRIVCGPAHVELPGRKIQETAAGTVLQLEPADVGVQRALVGLPAVLRSHPVAQSKVNRDATRHPRLVDGDAAREELFPRPAPPPSPSMAFEPIPEESESLAEETFTEHDRAAASRLAFNRPKIEAAVARIPSRSHFDFLSVHFSANRDEVAASCDELRRLVETVRGDDRERELAAQLDQLVARIDAAWEVLGDSSSRRAHRDLVVPRVQIEAAIEMYEGSAGAAKLSRRLDVVKDCLRRVVELQPGNGNARRDLEALELIPD